MRAGGRSALAALPALLAWLALAAGCGGSPDAPGAGAGAGAKTGAEAAGTGAAAGPSAAGPRGGADTPARAGLVDLSRANLVILSLDTLRADCTSMGGANNLTPSLARLASQSVVFTHARTQSPHTAPSHMSLFTSTYPSVHGVQNVAHEQVEGGASRPVIYPLREDIPTLAQVLEAAGFATTGITDGGNLNPPHGFARGFDDYGYELEGVARKVELGLEAVRALPAAGQRRSFLFWHTYQIHAPYVPPRSYIETWAPPGYDGVMKERIEQLGDLDFRKRFSLMKDLFWKDKAGFGWPEAAYLFAIYKGGVRYADDELARLVAALEQGPAFENTIVVLLADHGEEFFEHGGWQHDQLFEECLRVPLMVRLPGGHGGGRVIDVPVALVDVMPTVLDLLGVDARSLELPGRVRHVGVSLAPAILGGPPPRERPIVSEHIATRGPNFDQQLAIHYNGVKFLYDEVRGEKLSDGSVRHLSSIFELSSDPREQADVKTKRADLARFFQEQRAAFRKVVELEALPDGERAAAEIDDEMLRQFQELGYVGGDAGG